MGHVLIKNYKTEQFKTFVKDKIKEISPGHINLFKSKRYRDFYNYVMDNFYGKKFNERLYNYLNPSCIKNCKMCPKTTRFRSCVDGYSTYCGVKCVNKDPLTLQKSIETCFKEYKVENPAKLPSFQDKRRNTCLEIYKVDNPRKATSVKKK